MRPPACGEAGRPHRDPVRSPRPPVRVEAAGDVRADALAPGAVSDRRDSRAGAQDRPQTFGSRSGRSGRRLTKWSPRGPTGGGLRTARSIQSSSSGPSSTLSHYEKVRVTTGWIIRRGRRPACGGPADRNRSRTVLGSLPGEDMTRFTSTKCGSRKVNRGRRRAVLWRTARRSDAQRARLSPASVRSKSPRSKPFRRRSISTRCISST